MKFLLITLVFIVFLDNTVHAQNFGQRLQYGIHASGGVSQYTNYNAKSWQGGLVFTYPIDTAGIWQVNTGLSFAHRNYLVNEKYHYWGPVIGPIENLESYSVFGHYLELPLSLQLNYLWKEKKFLIIAAGVKSSFLLNAFHENLEITDWGRVLVPEKKERINEAFRPVDFSFFISKGLNFSYDKFIFSPSLYLQYGLTEAGGSSLGHFNNEFWSAPLNNWNYYYLGVNLQVVRL